MTDRELMQKAIEAMEYADACLKKQLTTKTKHEYAQELLFEAGIALRERLAQPEQEPVASVESVATVVSESGNKEITMSWWHEPALPVGTKLYTTPPQRKPLVWLSEEDERQIKDHCTTVACVLRATKAKLKEKNT